MWPLVRQARYLGRYRQIAQVLWHHGFGFLLEQLGLTNLLSLPRRMVLRAPPPSPTGLPERFCQALIELGPTFIKFGQLLSTRPDLLPPDFVFALDKLQDTVPSFPATVAIATIETELGRPIDQLFREFSHTPLAAASLGQVHAAVLPTGEQVVVKVQRPDIQGMIATDLAIISDLARLAQERTELGTQYDLVEVVWEFSSMLRSELDYRQEAFNAERFRRNFARNRLVHIPTIYWDYTSSRILTSERLRGVKINDVKALEAAGIDRVRLAHNSTRLILDEVFSHGFFQADPHPGNFFAMSGEVVGAIDFGQVITLDREMTRQLLLLLLALANRNNDDAIRAMERLGMLNRRNITPALRRDLGRFTNRVVDRPLTDLSARETGEELLALVQRHHLHMPGSLAMLLKAVIMMEGIGLQLDPNLDVFAITRPYARRVLTDQMSPGVLYEQTWRGTRDLSEALLALPHRLDAMLERLNEGELLVQTREEELQRVAGAIVGAANRVALALVLMALLLSIGLFAIAVNIGGWSGPVLVVLGVVGVIGVVFTGLWLMVALLRSRDV
jgi:ubiquinone biosynthesis protein